MSVRRSLLKYIAETETAVESDMPPAVLLAKLVADYFSKLGHASMCDVVERATTVVVLVVITTIPKESAAAIAMAQRHIELKARRIFSAPVLVFINFRAPRPSKEREFDAARLGKDIVVNDGDFSEFENLLTGTRR